MRDGAKVVLIDIRNELGERAAAARRAEGHEARYMHLDVTSDKAWAKVGDAVVTTHGRLDILLNKCRRLYSRKGRGNHGCDLEA